MIYTPGDIADLLTIAKLKRERLPSSYHDTRYETLMEEWNGYTHTWETMELLFSLHDINRQIWDLEAAIRNGDLKDLETIGRRALQIRDLNRNRIEHKNLINENWHIQPEVKINHVSEKRNNDNNNPTADKSNQSL